MASSDIDSTNVTNVSTEVETSMYRLHRAQEREQLQSLNDRLSQYIDKVKSFRGRNEELVVNLSELKNSRNKTLDATKADLEIILDNTRHGLDKAGKEKAQYQLKTEQQQEKIDKLKENIARLEKQHEHDEDLSMELEARAKKLQEDTESNDTEVSRLNGLKTKLEEEIDQLNTSISEHKLARIDAINKQQTENEKQRFHKSIIENEIAEEENLISELQEHYSKNEAEFKLEMQRKFEDAISELKDRSEQDLQSYRNDIEKALYDKQHFLQKDNEHVDEHITKLREELARLENRKLAFDKELHNVQKRNAELERMLKEQLEELENEKLEHNETVIKLQQASNELEVTYHGEISELQDLLDLRVALDSEINAYKQLVLNEEARLKLTPSSRKRNCSKHTKYQDVDDTPENKRSRSEDTPLHQAMPESTEETSNAIIFGHVEPTGNYVEITNQCDYTISLANYKIHNVNPTVEQVFTFHHRTKIPNGATIRIWANCEDGIQEPPRNYIWRQQAVWHTSAEQTLYLMKDSEMISSWSRANIATTTATTTTTTTTSSSSSITINDNITVDVTNIHYGSSQDVLYDDATEVATTTN